MFLPCFRMVPRQNNQYKDQAVGNVNSIKDLCEMRDEIRALLLRFGFASLPVVFSVLPSAVSRPLKRSKKAHNFFEIRRQRWCPGRRARARAHLHLYVS